MTEMTPKGLARKITKLRATRPITAGYERTLVIRGVWKSERVWYKSQKSTGWGGSQSTMDQAPMTAKLGGGDPHNWFTITSIAHPCYFG